jgi:CO/xanthine dehydrogenase Mo-binding subunit
VRHECARRRLRPDPCVQQYCTLALSPWVTIATDDTVAIMSPAAEMGQGSLTSLPLILAEELDADWSKVRIIVAPPNDELYKNPGFGFMYTAGSNAVTSYFKELRLFGAQVRKVLLANAARHWNVPVEELTTGPNVVIHEKSGRRVTYGEIAVFAEVPADPPEVDESELKKTHEFRLIGPTPERGASWGAARRRASSRKRHCLNRQPLSFCPGRATHRVRGPPSPMVGPTRVG